MHCEATTEITVLTSVTSFSIPICISSSSSNIGIIVGMILAVISVTIVIIIVVIIATCGLEEKEK